MPVIDKARVRVFVVIVLLIVAAAALHGYLPGGGIPARVRPTTSLGSLFTVVAILTVSMAIIAIAVTTQSRRASVSPSRGEPPRGMSVERRSVTWRMTLIAMGVVIAWLLLAALPSPLNMQLGIEHPDSPNVFWLLAGSTGLLIIVIAVGSMIATRRRQRRAIPAQVRSGDEYRSSATAGPESFARAAERGLAELDDLSREPREAIIAGYLAMNARWRTRQSPRRTAEFNWSNCSRRRGSARTS